MDVRLSRVLEARARAEADLVCPRCIAPGSTLTLLTSMVRYYTCSNCGCTWNETNAPVVDAQQLVRRGDGMSPGVGAGRGQR